MAGGSDCTLSFDISRVPLHIITAVHTYLEVGKGDDQVPKVRMRDA